MGQAMPWSLALTICETAGQRRTSGMTSRAVTHQVYSLERSLRPVVKMQVLQGARGANDRKEVWPAGWQLGAGAGVPRDSGSHIHI